MKYKIGDIVLLKTGSVFLISSITETQKFDKQNGAPLEGTEKFYNFGNNSNYRCTDEDIHGKIMVE